jgi:hypothetical protein
MVIKGAMLTFHQMRRRFRLNGFHGYHLIPIEVMDMQAFAQLFGRLRTAGFDPNDFGNNGMYLPCIEVQAAAFNLPLHRGPHPRYNGMVAERIATFERLHVQDALHQMSQLQQSLKSGLRGSQNLIRDPFRSKADFRRLDAEVELLWGHISATNRPI